jgi:hypothetical protein
VAKIAVTRAVEVTGKDFFLTFFRNLWKIGSQVPKICSKKNKKGLKLVYFQGMCASSFVELEPEAPRFVSSNTLTIFSNGIVIYV